MMRACRSPEVRPSDCWDWITPDDLVRHALAAYYAASRSMEPPTSEPFVSDGVGYAGRACFRDAVLGQLCQRLNVHALDYGVGPPMSLYCDLPPGRSWDELAGAGRSPADMGHGWPALAGAGSASQGSPEAEDAGGSVEVGGPLMPAGFSEPDAEAPA